MSGDRQTGTSTTADAMAAAGDSRSAKDIGELDAASQAADQKLATTSRGLVERLIYGPPPSNDELQAGARISGQHKSGEDPIVSAALDCLRSGKAFTAKGKLSAQLRKAVAAHNAYGFTVPAEYGGGGRNYLELATVEEQLAATGLGALAVEISGQLTIGAGALLAYGSEQQKQAWLPQVARGRLIGFALTEVGVGVNAKKIQAYVEQDTDGNYRLFAHGSRNKLWITNTTHGGLLCMVARIGKDSREIGLFILEMPGTDIQQDGKHDYEFRCEHSGVAAFGANHNSRLHFYNFPIPGENRIPADGVEALFYCLRMGRCMLAAMSAGYQRLLAHDAANYARQRLGVGGPVLRHEVPRLAIGTMLGGALQSRALAWLALQQDADGVDLAGLRDLTKSAAASSGVESMIACEHVMGGRSFHQGSRVNDARINLHLFSIVEGEDDMIRMGMVRDVTLRFVNTYLASLLRILNRINQTSTGEPIPAGERILRIGPLSMFRQPGKTLSVIKLLLTSRDFWQLNLWTAKNLALDLRHLPVVLVPSLLLPRYRSLPQALRPYARFAERRLRGLRWSYLWLSLYYQLELTRAQIPLQRLGRRIEDLVSMLAICHHAALQDSSQQAVALLQVQRLKDRVSKARWYSTIRDTRRTRLAVAAVGDAIEQARCSLLDGIETQEFGHPWEE